MKIRGGLRMNGREYGPGDEVPWHSIYPFFLFHMGLFGGSGFAMAYFADDAPLLFLYAHGGFAILIYTVFYISIFGLDEVKWMFINAGLGLLGIYGQVDWLLSFSGRRLGDYSVARNVIPFLYYTLYTFLLRHALLDLAGAADDEEKRQRVDRWYVAGSVALSALFWLFDRR